MSEVKKVLMKDHAAVRKPGSGSAAAPCSSGTPPPSSPLSSSSRPSSISLSWGGQRQDSESDRRNIKQDKLIGINEKLILEEEEV